MKILILNQFFFPDHSAVSQMATDLAEDLASAGHEVTALAAQGTYLGDARLPREDRLGPIRILRLPSTSLGKEKVWRRVVDYASFALSASVGVLRLPRQDVVVAMTTPPLIGTVGLLGRSVRHRHLVYWVQDLYPDVAIALGALRQDSSATKLTSALGGFCLRRSDRIVAIGEAMKAKLIAMGASPSRTVVVPNWADGEAIRPVAPSDNPMRDRLAEGAPFVVMYSGNMGRGHDIATLLEAAALLRDRRDMRFLFVGDGAKRADVELAAGSCSNIHVVDYQARSSLAESLSVGDVHLVSLLPELEGLIEPSKLYGIMAAGRPVLFVGPRGSEVAATIEAEHCGMVFENGDAASLARALVALQEGAEERLTLGRNGRRAIERTYGRRLATDRFRAVLEAL